MDFAWTDDDLALRDAVRRYADRAYPPPQRGNPPSLEQAARDALGLAELGLQGLTVSADAGGAGLGAVEALVAAQELGRAMVDGGFIGSSVMAASLLTALDANSARRQALLADLAQGQGAVAVAFAEPQQRYDWWQCACQAQPDGADGWRLSGQKAWVIGGGLAQVMLVLARVEGPQPPDSAAGHAMPDVDQTKLAVFEVRCDAPGVQRTVFRGLDGRWLAKVEMTDIAVPAQAQLGVGPSVAAAVDAMLDAGCAALCGEAVGIIEVLLEQTAEHLRTRKQFGAPLAKFQVLQHRLADIAIAHQQLLSMACAAAAAVDDGDPEQRRRVVSAAKALVGEQGRAIALQAIQMFGAMGMTDECRVGHYAKRLMVIGHMLGDASWHLRRMHRDRDMPAAHAAWNPAPLMKALP